MGVYNSLHGKHREKCALLKNYVATTSEIYKWDAMCGLPALRSTDCTGKGIVNHPDHGWACSNCFQLRYKKGNSNPRGFLIRWYDPILRATERRTKPELTPSDIHDAEKFVYNDDNRLLSDGRALKVEAGAQVAYSRKMKQLKDVVPSGTYKVSTEDGVPNMNSFFKTAADGTLFGVATLFF